MAATTISVPHIIREGTDPSENIWVRTNMAAIIICIRHVQHPPEDVWV